MASLLWQSRRLHSSRSHTHIPMDTLTVDDKPTPFLHDVSLILRGGSLFPIWYQYDPLLKGYAIRPTREMIAHFIIDNYVEKDLLSDVSYCLPDWELDKDHVLAVFDIMNQKNLSSILAHGEYIRRSMKEVGFELWKCGLRHYDYCIEYSTNKNKPSLSPIFDKKEQFFNEQDKKQYILDQRKAEIEAEGSENERHKYQQLSTICISDWCMCKDGTRCVGKIIEKVA